MNREQIAQMKKQEQIRGLMKQFNQLYKERQVRPGEAWSRTRAKGLDPDDVGVQAACQLATVHSAINEYESINKRKEEMTRRGLDDAEEWAATSTRIKTGRDRPVAMKIAQGRKGAPGRRPPDLLGPREGDSDSVAQAG